MEKTKEVALSTIQKTENLFNKDEVKARINGMLGKNSAGFITSVLSAIAANDSLKNADPNSVYMAAMTAASLNLPINPNLGLAYIVPYNVKQQDGSFKTLAQFQMGYKGFKQLAMRSGQFIQVHATDVRDGELVAHNRLTGELTLVTINDDAVREKAPIVGYASYFKLLNGFTSTFYMTVKEIEQHAGRYSKSYAKGFGLWKDDKHKMSLKTVTKLHLNSGSAPLSIEMQRAAISDQAVINDFDTLDVDYRDNEAEKVDPLNERIIKLIDAAENSAQMEQILVDAGSLPEELMDHFNAKIVLINSKSKK